MGTKYQPAFALCIALLVSSCAGSSSYMKTTQTLLQPTEAKAMVRFLRPSGMGAAINFNVLDGDKVIGNSVSKSQFDYLATPGKHLFIATAENKVFLEADLEAGKTYYIITRIYPGAWYARVAFVGVNRGSEYWNKVNEWERELQKLEPDQEAIRKWEDANRGKITNVLSQYESEWKTKYNWPKLMPEDGR
jgi:hypothetical protein